MTAVRMSVASAMSGVASVGKAEPERALHDTGEQHHHGDPRDERRASAIRIRACRRAVLSEARSLPRQGDSTTIRRAQGRAAWRYRKIHIFRRQSRVADARDRDAATYIDGGRAVPAGHGWEWIATGWAHLQAPGRACGSCSRSCSGMIVIAISLDPVLGSLACRSSCRSSSAVSCSACRKIERGEDIELADLFSGFQRSGGPLVLVGLIGLGLYDRAS